MFVTLQNYGRRTATRYQSITIAIERTTGTSRMVLTNRKRLYSIECRHTVQIGFLRTTAYDTFLQTIPNEQRCQSY